MIRYGALTAFIRLLKKHVLTLGEHVPCYTQEKIVINPLAETFASACNAMKMVRYTIVIEYCEVCFRAGLNQQYFYSDLLLQ